MKGTEGTPFAGSDLSGSEPLENSSRQNCRLNSLAHMRLGSVRFDQVVDCNTHPEMGL